MSHHTPIIDIDEFSLILFLFESSLSQSLLHASSVAFELAVNFVDEGAVDVVP